MHALTIEEVMTEVKTLVVINFMISFLGCVLGLHSVVYFLFGLRAHLSFKEH